MTGRRSPSFVRRTGYALAVVLASLGGCSLFAPAFDEYAREPAPGGGAPAQGGGGEPGAGLGAAGSELLGGAGGEAGLATGGDGESAGAGGAPEEPDPPDVKGESVASDDYQLERTVWRGLPVLALVTAYDADEASVTAPHRDLPRYAPYDPTSPAYFDYLASELIQARAPVIALPTRGVSSLDPSDWSGPGNMNPRRLGELWAALGRASAQFPNYALCLVDTPYLQAVANTFHGTPASAPLDLALSSDWDDVFWSRAIEPWFDALPEQAWFDWNGPVIQFGPLPSGAFVNANGNLSGLLTRLGDNFTSAYDRSVHFILDASWFTLDPSVATHPRLFGRSPWLIPTTSSQAFATTGWFTTGTIVPGAVDPGFYDPTSPRYQDESYVLPRATTDAYGNEVSTLLTGLSAATQTASRLALVYGLNAVEHRAALYPSLAGGWEFPNQYLNLYRRYADPKTFTLRLEAENCDRYRDHGDGNSGKVFLREGDLDVRALAGSGWAVTDTAADEWIEFRDVDFSTGSYRFIARFSTSNSGAGKDVTKRIQLIIDGRKLAPVIVTDTATSDVFDATSLGVASLAHGPHTLRVRFLDGFVDLDWLFLRKLDPVLSLQTQNGAYESAQEAGGSHVQGTAPNPSIFEEFTFDDLNGGELEDGDDVHIQTHNGLYLTMITGLGVRATARVPGNDETFQVQLVSGAGVATAGSTIAILAPDGVHYLTDGDASRLDATGTSVGPAQTFTVGRFR